MSGPTALSPKNSQIKLIRVVSAKQMHTAVFQYYHKVDIAIAAAAVADFTPVDPAQQKIKKNTGLPKINLIPTVDILAEMGEQKKQQFLLGFALETENELDNAMAKCTRKNADAIVLNSLKDTDAGFGGDKNKITFIRKNGTTTTFELKAKTEVAVDIFAQITASL